MAFGNWEMQAGDPSLFAFGLAFMRNPHDDDRATVEESTSWGAFTVWAGGENLCAHLEQGEVLDSAHWYLLPLMEWLVDNWDPLLHEERLPLRNAGLSAAESLWNTRLPPVSLKEIDELSWLDAWSGWWDRHSIRSARDGGLYPDVYLRRYRGSLEISTGAEALPGIPTDHVFLSPNRIYHVDPLLAAEAFFTVLKAAIAELRRRLPNSQRLRELEDKADALASPERFESRMAWLAGMGDNIGRYTQAAAAVDDALSSVSQEEREAITGAERTTPLVVVGSAFARLLYGAVSPSTTQADVLTLTRRIIDNYVPDASRWLTILDLPIAAADVGQLRPGEQGSRLGERVAEILAADSGSWIDVVGVLETLDVQVSQIDLSDQDIRAVSVFGPTQRPHIFCNRRTIWGATEPVRRFTLAHELCHLIFDREYGDELAIATGPWAPLAIEQRANAFSAAFLMPTWLLRDAFDAIGLPAPDPKAIRSLSARLKVSASSLVDRLYNLGELTVDERLQLRPIWPSGPQVNDLAPNLSGAGVRRRETSQAPSGPDTVEEAIQRLEAFGSPHVREAADGLRELGYVLIAPAVRVPGKRAQPYLRFHDPARPGPAVGYLTPQNISFTRDRKDLTKERGGRVIPSTGEVTVSHMGGAGRGLQIAAKLKATTK
jgi:Zn-dependent peptidase ImmA (M78 family)